MTPQSALKPFFDIGKNYIVKNLKSFNGQSRLLPQKIEENYTIIFNEETKQIIRRIVFDLLEVDNFLGKEQAKDERKEIESKWEEQKKQKEETQEKVNKVQNVALPGVGIVAAASGLALAFLLGGKTRRRKYKNRTRRKRIKMTKIRK